MLYHKTTHREVYEQAGREVPDGTEAVLFNAYGELTESTIANLALRIDGIWYTPPLNSGCLPGIYRRQLIEDGTLVERILPVSALDSAEEIGLINSVRGWRRGVLD